MACRKLLADNIQVNMISAWRANHRVHPRIALLALGNLSWSFMIATVGQSYWSKAYNVRPVGKEPFAGN